MPPTRQSKSLSTAAPRRYSARQLSKSKSPGDANGASTANNGYLRDYRDSSSPYAEFDDSPSPTLTSSPEPSRLPIRKAREICTPEQKEELDRLFEDSNGYPSRADKEALSARIGKSLKSIEIWLQNKRHPRKSNSPGGRGWSGKSKGGGNHRKNPYSSPDPQDLPRRSTSTTKSPQTPMDDISTPPLVVTPTTPTTAPVDTTPLPPPVEATIVYSNEPETYKSAPGIPNDNVTVAVNRGPWLNQDEERLWSVAVSTLGVNRERKLINMAVEALLTIGRPHN